MRYEVDGEEGKDDSLMAELDGGLFLQSMANFTIAIQRAYVQDAEGNAAPE